LTKVLKKVVGDNTDHGYYSFKLSLFSSFDNFTEKVWLVTTPTTAVKKNGCSKKIIRVGIVDIIGVDNTHLTKVLKNVVGDNTDHGSAHTFQLFG